MTPTEFRRRLAGAEPGHIIEYHRGSCLHGHDAMAEEAREAAMAGRVILTQKRYGSDDYGYQATVAEDTQFSHWAEARTHVHA